MCLKGFVNILKKSKFIDRVEEYLKDVLPNGRFEHTIRVGKLAKELADHYKVNVDQAYLAGIMHDIAKKREDDLLKVYDISGIFPKEDWEKFRPILHSPLGYFEAKEVFKVEDEDILNAILYHTTGRPNMSTLEKIIYIADACEPGREGKNIEEIRQMAFSDLDKAMIMTMDMGLKKCLCRERVIHPLTVDARNYYLQKGVDFE